MFERISDGSELLTLCAWRHTYQAAKIICTRLVFLTSKKKKKKKSSQPITKHVLRVRIERSELSRGKINYIYIKYCVRCKIIHGSWSQKLWLALCLIQEGLCSLSIMKMSSYIFFYCLYFFCFVNPAVMYSRACLKIGNITH